MADSTARHAAFVKPAPQLALFTMAAERWVLAQAVGAAAARPGSVPEPPARPGRRRRR